MKDELYFENIEEIGNLYLEHVFLEFEKEPILMTCVDDRKQLYLCLCAEIRGEQRWIVSSCSVATLAELVEGKIDIASALCVPEQLVMVTRDLQGMESSIIIKTDEVDRLDLPKDGTLLKCNQTAAKAYLMNKRLLELSFRLSETIDSTYYGEKMMSYSIMFSPIAQVLNDNYTAYVDWLSGQISNLVKETFKETFKQTYRINIDDTYVDGSDKKQTDNLNYDYLQAA